MTPPVALEAAVELMERLRDRRGNGKWADSYVPDALCHEAADHIAVLAQQVAELTAEVAGLEAEKASAFICGEQRNAVTREIVGLTIFDGEAKKDFGFVPKARLAQQVADKDAEIERLRVALTEAKREIAVEHAYRDRAEARLAASEQSLSLCREALADLLHHVDRETCEHESVHRGGVIWTICDECGEKWADDEGGFTPYADPPAVARARAALRSNGDDDGR